MVVTIAVPVAVAATIAFEARTLLCDRDPSSKLADDAANTLPGDAFPFLVQKPQDPLHVPCMPSVAVSYLLLNLELQRPAPVL